MLVQALLVKMLLPDRYTPDRFFGKFSKIVN